MMDRELQQEEQLNMEIQFTLKRISLTQSKLIYLIALWIT